MLRKLKNRLNDQGVAMFKRQLITGGGIMSSKAIFLAIFFMFSIVFQTWASEPFPNREIEIIVPWDPGGGMDTMSRAVAPTMSEVLGVPVVVINKPGASGTVGSALLAKRKPDGYSLGAASATPNLFAPHLQKVEYDPIKDFDYVGGCMAQPMGVQVLAGAPWKTFQDFLDDAKKNPGKIKISTYGVNSMPDVFMRAIAKDNGITWTLVPFKGDGPTLPAVLGGHVHASTLSVMWAPQAKAGKMRALVLFTEKRISDFPDIPTLNELGFNYYLGAAAFNGLAAPKGLPQETLKKLEHAVKLAVDSPKFKEICKNVSFEVYYQNKDDFTKSAIDGLKRIGDMLKRIGGS